MGQKLFIVKKQYYNMTQYITNYVTDLDTQLTSNNCVCVPFALSWYLVYSWQW